MEMTDSIFWAALAGSVIGYTVADLAWGLLALVVRKFRLSLERD